MAKTATTEEWAKITNRSVEEVEDLICNAETLPPGSLDPSTLTSRNITPATIERMRRTLVEAGIDPENVPYR